MIIIFYSLLIVVFTEPKQQSYVRENRILGQLKLTLHYQRGAFMVSNIILFLLLKI